MANGDIGSYEMYITANSLFSKTKASFLSKMKNNHCLVSHFPLEESQITAWGDCYDVLESAFEDLPIAFWNLWLVFEYVLPQHNPTSNKLKTESHILADVLIVSAEKVLVLEFKQMKDPFIGLFHQAKKYKNRLEKYHVESRNMKIESILVLTKADEYYGSVEDVLGCSPDMLGETIEYLMGKNPRPHSDITGWLNSEFSLIPSFQEDRNYNSKEEDFFDGFILDPNPLPEDLMKAFGAGTFIYHSTFGYGEVKGFEESGGDQMIVVDFREGGNWKFLFPSCVKKNVVYRVIKA